MSFLYELEQVIRDRKANPTVASYTSKLFAKGLPRIVQKVGEEGVEVVVAAALQDNDHLVGECADLCYHLLVLLVAKDLSLADIEAELVRRHAPPAG